MAFAHHDDACAKEAQRLREEEDYTLQQIADKFEVSRSTAHRWCVGIALPSRVRTHNRNGDHTITDETREKFAEAARKGNSTRVYTRKPIHELKSASKIRDRLFEERGRRCEKCDWDKENPQGVVPVEVHHKDGDRTNNHGDNLIILCPNCHSLTDNYMFHGRSHRGTYGRKGVKRHR
jgi:predicted HNH restriction endonuclease